MYLQRRKDFKKKSQVFNCQLKNLFNCVKQKKNFSHYCISIFFSPNFSSELQNKFVLFYMTKLFTAATFFFCLIFSSKNSNFFFFLNVLYDTYFDANCPCTVSRCKKFLLFFATKIRNQFLAMFRNILRLPTVLFSQILHCYSLLKFSIYILYLWQYIQIGPSAHI